MKLQIGDKAPAFTSQDQDGKEVKLSDFAGKKVVLYFYPKDNTPGCTTQACDLRDNIDHLKAAGYVVLGVSIDDVKSHKKFADKFNLPFTLVADSDHQLVEAYGVWVEKSMYGRSYMGTARTTFIIDEKCIITDIIEKVKTKEHSKQILG